MGFISDITTEKKVSVAIYSKTVSVINGVVQPEAYTLVSTVDSLFWTSGKSVSFYSDKLGTKVDAVAAIDYLAAIAVLKDNTRLVAGDLNYQILHIEDVGQQNEMIEIPVKRESSNG